MEFSIIHFTAEVVKKIPLPGKLDRRGVGRGACHIARDVAFESRVGFGRKRRIGHEIDRLFVFARHEVILAVPFEDRDRLIHFLLGKPLPRAVQLDHIRLQPRPHDMPTLVSDIDLVVVSVNIRLPIVIDEHTRIENRANLIRYRFAPRSNGGLAFGNADMGFVVGKVEIIPSVLVSGIRRVHLSRRPRILPGLQNYAVVDPCLEIGRFQHDVVLHVLEVLRISLVVRAIDIDLTVKDLGGGIGGIKKSRIAHFQDRIAW